MSIILFLVILAVLIISHEFGHFIVAKRSGIRVDEFAIGFPPKIFSWTKGETKYSLNLLPFGGFVKIFGEDPNDETLNGPDKARSFTSKSKWVQASVVSAGVVFNLILAYLLFSIGYAIGLPSPVDSAPRGAIISNEKLTITSVLKGSPAEKAGIMPGDRIIEIGTSIENPRNTPLTPESDRVGALTPESVQKFIETHGKEKIAVIFERGKDLSNAVIVTPEEGVVEGKPAIGVALDVVGTARLPIYLALIEGGKSVSILTYKTVSGIYDLLKKSLVGEQSLSGLTGPVGIVGLVGDASQFGFAYLISFVALISINLAVLNLLPFPALDGGRLLFIIIEGVTRKTIPPKIANTLNFLGFALLIILMLVVTYHDIARLLVKS